ncbi:hypothetical protein [Facklamia sp. P12955]|uniref:hypothetical protein n=1 Tax=unclassified Facklamia TaxID=2622293 RepID=UPI003D17B94B
MDQISQSLSNLDGAAIAVLLICSVIIATLTELIKAFDVNSRLSSNLIRVITLLIGQTMAIIFAWILGQDWTLYTFIGLAAAIMSTGIYEWSNKFVNSLFKGISNE